MPVLRRIAMVTNSGGDRPPFTASPPGHGVAPLAAELAKYALDGIYTVEHDLLADYTPDGYSAAIRQLVDYANPFLVLFPHTYQVRDYAPKLATSLRRVMISDVIAHRVETLKNCDVILELNQGRLMRIHKRAPQLWSLAAGT